MALEQLSRLLMSMPETSVRSPAGVLRKMRKPPHPSSADADELDTAIAAGRLPIYLLDTNAIRAPGDTHANGRADGVWACIY
jgi:hypothetical protein